MPHHCDDAFPHYKMSEASFSSPRQLEGREDETDAK
jgi:hypothetical protein